MSHEPQTAVIIFGLPLALIGGLVVAFFIVFAVTFLVLRRTRAMPSGPSAWQRAAEELGIDLLIDATELGDAARGTVNSHSVSMAPFASSGLRPHHQTMYTVSYESPEAPMFSLTGRTEGAEVPVLDTGNPKFDAVVAVNTDHPVLFSRFLTPPRRAAILRLLMQWPDAEITHRDARLVTDGVEANVTQLVDSVCHLVATAETFDRPTSSEPSQPGTATTADVANAADALSGDEAADDGDVLTEIRVDEVTVFHDLFASNLDTAGIAARFGQVYRGRQVTWSGEVVRVGTFDESGDQRIAALVGSANGQDASSGRVVAITTVSPTPTLQQGDVVSFSGTLSNLNVDQRLFHLT